MAKKIMSQGTSSNVGKRVLKPFLLKLKIWPSIRMSLNGGMKLVVLK